MTQLLQRIIQSELFNFFKKIVFALLFLQLAFFLYFVVILLVHYQDFFIAELDFDHQVVEDETIISSSDFNFSANIDYPCEFHSDWGRYLISSVWHLKGECVSNRRPVTVNRFNKDGRYFDYYKELIPTNENIFIEDFANELRSGDIVTGSNLYIINHAQDSILMFSGVYEAENIIKQIFENTVFNS